MQAIFNHEEVIGKTVGRRRPPVDSLAYAFALQKTCNDLMGGMRIPRGVYRFKSHEEADQWLMDHLTRKRAN